MLQARFSVFALDRDRRESSQSTADLHANVEITNSEIRKAKRKHKTESLQNIAVVYFDGRLLRNSSI